MKKIDFDNSAATYNLYELNHVLSKGKADNTLECHIHGF